MLAITGLGWAGYWKGVKGEGTKVLKKKEPAFSLPGALPPLLALQPQE